MKTVKGVKSLHRPLAMRRSYGRAAMAPPSPPQKGRVEGGFEMLITDHPVNPCSECRQHCFVSAI